MLGKKYDKKWEATVFTIEAGTIIGWENDLSNFEYPLYMLDLWNSPLLPVSLTENRKDEKKDALKEKLDNRYNKQTGEGFNQVVASDIENVIIKFFNTIPSAEQLLNHIDNDESNRSVDELMMYQISLLYHQNGEQEKAKRILKKIQNSFIKDWIQEYVNHAGIVI